MHGVAALDAERGRLGGHVGAGLVDHQHHAERDAHLLHREAVGAASSCRSPAPTGSGSAATSAMARGDAGEPLRVERQPVEEGGGLAGRAGRRPGRPGWRPGWSCGGPGWRAAAARSAGSFARSAARASARARAAWPSAARARIAAGRARCCGRAHRRRLADRASVQDHVVPVDHLVGYLIAEHPLDLARLRARRCRRTSSAP